MRHLLVLTLITAAACTPTENPERPSALHGTWVAEGGAPDTYRVDDNYNIQERLFTTVTKTLALGAASATLSEARSVFNGTKGVTEPPEPPDTREFPTWAVARDSTIGMALLCLQEEGIGRSSCFRLEQVADTLTLSSLDEVTRYVRSAK